MSVPVPLYIELRGNFFSIAYHKIAQSIVVFSLYLRINIVEVFLMFQMYIHTHIL